MDITMKAARDMLESVDEYDGTLASAVRQGIKNAIRKYNIHARTPSAI